MVRLENIVFDWFKDLGHFLRCSRCFNVNVLPFLWLIHVICSRLLLRSKLLYLYQEFYFLENTSHHDIYFQLWIYDRFAFWEMLCLTCQTSVLITSGVPIFFQITVETKPSCRLCTSERLILGPWREILPVWHVQTNNARSEINAELL